MQDKIRMNTLLDYYESLLTAKQREVCGYYYRQDLSLNEIAELMHVSRTAVYDTVSRCVRRLEQCEKDMRFVDGSEKRRRLYEQIRTVADNAEVSKLIRQCIDTETEGGQDE